MVPMVAAALSRDWATCHELAIQYSEHGSEATDPMLSREARDRQHCRPEVVHEQQMSAGLCNFDL